MRRLLRTILVSIVAILLKVIIGDSAQVFAFVLFTTTKSIGCIDPSYWGGIFVLLKVILDNSAQVLALLLLTATKSIDCVDPSCWGGIFILFFLSIFLPLLCYFYLSLFGRLWQFLVGSRGFFL